MVTFLYVGTCPYKTITTKAQRVTTTTHMQVLQMQDFSGFLSSSLSLDSDQKKIIWCLIRFLFYIQFWIRIHNTQISFFLLFHLGAKSLDFKYDIFFSNRNLQCCKMTLLLAILSLLFCIGKQYKNGAKLVVLSWKSKIPFFLQLY